MLLIRGVLFLLLFGVIVSGPAEAQSGVTVDSLTVSPATTKAGQTVTFAATITATQKISNYPLEFSWFPAGAATSTATTAVVYVTVQANEPITETYIETIPADTAVGSYTLNVGSASTAFTITGATVTAVSGACGPVNGTDLTSAPTTDLCSAGTASAVTGTGPWTWTCAGSHGGTTASCRALAGDDPTVGFLPQYNDVYANWQKAGLASVGGIPTRTTVCATVSPKGGGADDFTDIQNAINACPAGEVVQLAAGAFSVELADLPISISNGIVLRGASCTGSTSPYCQTSITVANGALAYTGGMCGTSTSAETACPNGGEPVILISPVHPDYNYSFAHCGNVGAVVGTGCGAVALTADASQGQTTIQVASTAGFSVGEWVLIDEASGAGWVPDPLNATTGYGSVWAAPDWLSSSGSPATGRVMWSKSENGGGWDFGSTYPYQANSVGCWYSYCDRPTQEIHRIASIGTGTLTFDDPLTVAFRESGGHNAQVYPGLYSNQSGTGTPIPFLQYAGVENISVLRAAAGGMEMEFCAYCWIKNVEVGDWYGGGISIEHSVRSELNTDYVHHCWDSVNNGGEYPIALDTASTEMLITNSITNFGGKGMVARAGGAGSVVSYSYVDDTMYDSYSGIGDYWVDMGVNASHYSGPHHVLFEGDWGDNLDNDHTHGNSMYITFFRNLGTSLRTPFTDPSINEPVDDFTGEGWACGTTGASSCSANAPAPLRAAGPSAYNYWFAFVGNVLGTAGETTAANGWSYQGDWTQKRIFMLGWNDGNGGEDPYLDGISGSYIFRNGDYDYFDGAIVDWAAGYSHALPNSFYLSSEPTFFSEGASCTYTWPWVTPTGSTPIQSNSCGGPGLPAKARYDAGTPFTQP
jgi:hypothetical protein